MDLRVMAMKGYSRTGTTPSYTIQCNTQDTLFWRALSFYKGYRQRILSPADRAYKCLVSVN